MISAPDGGADEHLKALASLSQALMDADVKAGLDKATTKADVEKVFADFVAKTEDPKEEKPVAPSGEKLYIIAVTACPTGIAHTFMAAEKIKETAKAMGLDVKVETNGQIGVENKLTKEDIERAAGIIVAADKKVEVARFDGRPTIMTKVADGINKPEELIQTILDGKAPIYKHDGAVDASEDSSANESIGRRAYKHLMEGVSNMLPFVVAGGILIALSFIWGINSFDPKDPSYNKVAEVLFYFGKISFSMMLPILAGFIGRSIADRPGFIVGMIGGILADPSILGLKSDLLAYTPSGFLGALVAGFLAGGIIQVLKIAFSWMPWHLDFLFNELDLNLNLDIIGSKVVDNESKLPGGIRRNYFNTLSGEQLWLTLAYRNVFNHSTVIFKKKAYEEAGRYDSEFDGFEDWHLWARMVTKNNAVVLNTVMAHYRLSESYKKRMLFRSRLARSRGLRLEDVIR